jgi:hypothetical protein
MQRVRPHLGPRLSPELALIYDTQKQKGHANRATLAVARKLVAYLLAVDRSGQEFVVAGQRSARSRIGDMDLALPLIVDEPAPFVEKRGGELPL